MIEKFQGKGSIKDGRDKNKRPSLSDGDVTRIKQHFETNPKASVRKASVDFNIYIVYRENWKKRWNSNRTDQPMSNFEEKVFMGKLNLSIFCNTFCGLFVILQNIHIPVAQIFWQIVKIPKTDSCLKIVRINGTVVLYV